MNINNKITAIITCMIFISCQSDVSKAYVPESNGNINALTVVMNNSLWEGRLGNNIKVSFYNFFFNPNKVGCVFNCGISIWKS